MKTDWPRAYRALKRLLDHPESTENAFEVFYTLDPSSEARPLKRFLATAEGRQLFLEQPILLDWLGDRPRLEALPEGSFGRAYLEHLDRNGLDARKLVEMRRATDPEYDGLDAGHRWFIDRLSLMHDLWHVLTGYGADGFGEAALLPFGWTQTGGRAAALLSAGACVRAWIEIGRAWPRYFWRAWRRGKRAGCLLSLRYEELLPLPLAEVRRAVGIEEPERAHPGGVLIGQSYG